MLHISSKENSTGLSCSEIQARIRPKHRVIRVGRTNQNDLMTQNNEVSPWAMEAYDDTRSNQGFLFPSVVSQISDEFKGTTPCKQNYIAYKLSGECKNIVCQAAFHVVVPGCIPSMHLGPKIFGVDLTFFGRRGVIFSIISVGIQ